MFQRIHRFWTDRPLLAMLAIGGMLFGLRALLLPAPKEPLVIDARTVDRVVEERANLLARDLTTAERDEAVRDLVDQEILLLEAHRRGLHLTSGRARARLIRKMRTGLNAEVPPPTFPQLRAFFTANSERYRVPEAITLIHVFYDRERLGEQDPPSPLDSLEAGVDFRDVGDPYWLGPVLGGATQDRLAATLGPEFASKSFDLPLNTWAGPLESGRGIHYVRVVERYPPSLPELELVRDRVELDWYNERRADVTDRKLEQLSEGYDVVLEGTQ